ncbi:hypothetical protein EK21DRAFT_53881 [Setomelanomma holmii]|uniref:Pentatricopeptide repeat-containing protein n=1 Tax=Setomelanomma holmii TaxID=210430 RepID=A0A9P4HJ49_9PLEO|nr:hypothetical protein EK21DRAFT_53881 [Setomelanomma holmii]
MPPARISNASFIASAEFPILPFLAPRIFAESPIRRRSDRYNEQRRGIQKEKEKEDNENVDLRAASELASRSTYCNSPRHRCQGPGTAGGLLQMTAPPWKSPVKTQASNPAAVLYAEISGFARTRLSTTPIAKASPRKVASRRRKTPEKASEVGGGREISGLRQQSPLLAARRGRALALERQRLDNLISRTAGQTAATRWQDGRYRSLLRRISNLERWDSCVLDLAQKGGGSLERQHLIRAFAALDRSLYPSVGRHSRKIIIRHDPRCVKWSADLFRDAAKHELHLTWKNWIALDIRTRTGAWCCLLLYLLDRKPGRAMQFIHVIANDPLLRGEKSEAIADALGHLSKLHTKGVYAPDGGWSVDKTAVKRSYVPSFLHIYRKALIRQRNVCSQDLLFNLVELSDIKDLKKVFDSLVESRAFLSFDTFLHYANAFAKAGEFKSALRCLDVLGARTPSASWGAVSDRERLRWTCALILRKSIANNQNYHETPGIVAAIVRLGIRMDIRMYNVVMHNAMEAGDYATAFKVYNALESNGLQADQYTHSILLHGCASQSDPTRFSRFATHCADIAEKTQDAWLATDYLYYLWASHQNDTDKQQTLALLRQAYDRFFLPKPIEVLEHRPRNTISVNKSMESSSNSPLKLRTLPVALYLLLQAHIQLAMERGTQQVLSLYQRFQLLVQQDTDSTLTELAKRPIIWNAFLLAFCKQQQFASASQLIKDMTNGSPQPNIYTWNIFMQAFFKTSQVQAAERVFEILRSRGVDPDQYTHGVLLRGYAKAQHVERIGEIMQQVTTEDEMDTDLLRLLARIVNRNKLMLTLEKSRLYKEVKLEEAVRSEAEEVGKRWEAPRLTLNEPEAMESNPVALPSDDKAAESDNSLIEENLDLQPQDAFEDGYDFLRPSSSDADPPPVSAPPLRSVQESLEDEMDPEVQYRRLREQLGIVAPDLSKTLHEAPGGPAPPSNPFGAGLGFKSMLPRVETPAALGDMSKGVIRKVESKGNPIEK